MPFLRFARDSRGYESTFLMHASRRRGGKTRQRILYWFRSPPNVKVGRAALDEDAIRWIEEHNPDVKFDWPRILEVEPPAPAPAADPRRRRPGEQRQQRQQRQQREQKERPGGREAAKDGGQRRREEAPPPPQTLESQAEEAIEQMEMEQIEQDIDDLNPDAGPGVTAGREPEAARPAVEAAITRILSKEQLMSFRARFAELQARIRERAGSPERMEALRARAEGLNPDTWVTEDDVRKGMAEFEPQVRELRAALGLRRRRRSRRGGHRHRRAGAEAQPQGTPGEKRDGDIFPGPAGQETPSRGSQEISPSPFFDEPNGEDDF